MMLEVFGILFILFMPFVYLFVLAYTLLALYVHSNFQFTVVPPLIDAPRELSIIIPFRNEAANIKACIDSIRNQKGLDPEVILVDDHSDDLSAEIAEVALEGLDGKVIRSAGYGKKAALLSGIAAASYPIVWTCDADCTVSEGTLLSMLKMYKHQQLNMLCGVVQIAGGKGFLRAFQQAESAALVGLSAVFLNQNRPATCNGANLMFDKALFYRLGAYSDDLNTSSGDDDLLMHKFAEYDVQKVKYHVVAKLNVVTAPEPSLSAFIRQRARWASKRRRYKFPYNTILLLMMASRVFFFIFLLALTLLFHSAWFYLPFALLLFSDLLMARKIKRLVDFKIGLIPFMSFYQLYIPFVWLYGTIAKVEWKGRRISTFNEKV